MNRWGRLIRLRVVAATVLGVTALFAAGCVGLPDEGPIHRLPDDAAGEREPAPHFAPPGPAPGDSPDAVVRGFLLAMQANPPSTAVARSFLTAPARSGWQPNRGTVVYDEARVGTRGHRGTVTVRLSEVNHLDQYGNWRGPWRSADGGLGLRVVREQGEWRIADPVDALLVPTTYFRRVFEPYDRFFFDASREVLVPDRVYLPRGDQTATDLVRATLAGPSPELAPITARVPADRFELEQPVRIGEDGLAEVMLGPAPQRLTPAELDGLVSRLVWTLRQVRGITALRLIVDGTPRVLPDGRRDIPIDGAPGADPFRSAEPAPIVLVDGRIARLVNDSVVPIGGPMRQPVVPMRSLAWDPVRERIVGVPEPGHTLVVAPRTGPAGSGRVRTRLTGTDLLRPVFDRFGGLWVLDRTGSGVVVHHIQGNRRDTVRIRGISSAGVRGSSMAAFIVTRDGNRFVGLTSGGGSPALWVSEVVRGEDGSVEPRPARRIEVGAAEGAVAVDVAQIGGATVAVLTRDDDGNEEILPVDLDGGPGDIAARPTAIPPGPASVVLTGSPDPTVPLRVLRTDGRVWELSATGRWSAVPIERIGALAATP